MKKIEIVFWGVICGLLGCRPPKHVQKRMGVRKDVYRWIRFREDQGAHWVPIGWREPDGSKHYLKPMIGGILWYDGTKTPARYAE